MSVHKNVAPGETSPIYNMPAVLPYPPSQGPGVNCSDGPFRVWNGADMRRDGHLIAMIRGGPLRQCTSIHVSLPSQWQKLCQVILALMCLRPLMACQMRRSTKQSPLWMQMALSLRIPANVEGEKTVT